MADDNVVDLADRGKKRKQPPQGSSDGRPEIRHVDGELPRVLDEVIEAVSTLQDRGLFVSANRLVRIYTIPQAETGEIRRSAGAVRQHQVDATHLTELATLTARHYRWDRRLEDWRAMNCPRRIAEAVLSRGHWPELPQLTGIVEAPTLTAAGALIDRGGYHRSSGLFLTSCPVGYKSPSRAPTLADARAGIERIKESISTFPFVGDADQAAMLAAILTALVRRSLPAAPMVAITAPTPGTGKSLLADIVATIALGRQAAMLALGDDEAETEKRLYAALLAGDSLLVADNVEVPLRGTLLCQVLTQPSVQFRPLGFSTIVGALTNLTFIATGNNLSIIGDLRRRILLVRLDAQSERPERRAFMRDAIEYVRQRRGSLIRDALTVMLAYRTAGSPHVGLPPFGGFVEWDTVVRRSLVWAGCPDPLQPAEGLRETDPDLETMRALFGAWRSVFGDAGATVAEAIAAARKYVARFDGDTDPAHPELRDALQAAAGDKLDSRKLGWWLRRHRDRVIDGLTLHQDLDSHTKVARWKVRQ